MSDFQPIKSQNGDVVGIWIKNIEDPETWARLQMIAVSFNAEELHQAIVEESYRKVPNTIDGNGGHFIMLNGVPAPGENPDDFR